MAHPDDGISVPYYSNVIAEYLMAWDNIANILNGKKHITNNRYNILILFCGFFFGGGVGGIS